MSSYTENKNFMMAVNSLNEINKTLKELVSTNKETNQYLEVINDNLNAIQRTMRMNS